MTKFRKIVLLIAMIVAAVAAVIMMNSCATTSKALAPVITPIQKCAPPTSEFSALVLETVDGATTVENALTEAEVLAAQTAICTVTQIAKEVIAAATGIKLAETVGPAPMREQWAAAWVKAHP